MKYSGKHDKHEDQMGVNTATRARCPTAVASENLKYA